MESKICTKCKLKKLVSEFQNDKSKSDGKRPSCKACKANTDKSYKDANKEKVRTKDKKYYQANSEKIKDKARVWYENNKEHHLQRSKQWRMDNHDKWVAGKRRWLEANKEKMMTYINDYIKNKYQNDLQYRIKSICAARIRSLIKKTAGTLVLIGCQIAFFHDWIEYQFDESMNWDNIGKHWHFDHVVPCSSFDLTDEESLRKCFHWTNIRPLEARANLQKHDKIIPSMIQDHKMIVKQFLSYTHDVPSLQ